MIVNRQEVSSALLAPGSIIKIGKTELKFDLKLKPNTSQSELNISAAANPQRDRSHLKRLELQRKENGRKKFYSVLVITAILFGLLMMQEKPVEEGLNLRDEEAIQEEIAASEQRKLDIQKLRSETGKNSQNYIQAQSNYLRGAREYREGNFLRAISYYQAALSLYPKHEMAGRYLRVAQRKLQEQIQYTMFEANTYREQGKYKQAASSYKHVMILVRDPNNTTYIEAKSLFDECNLLLKGGF